MGCVCSEERSGSLSIGFKFQMDHDASFAWNGYYTQFETRHPMKTVLKIYKGKISGEGSDDVGRFEWDGTVIDGNVKMTKQYLGQHAVEYTGKLADGVMTGSYRVGDATGDFELKREQHPEPENVDLREEVMGEAKWSGFYEQFGAKHDMDFTLIFGRNGNVSGKGKDEVGDFEWSGTLNAAGPVKLTKQYIGQHAVEYEGCMFNGTISGTYSVGDAKGDFQLTREGTGSSHPHGHVQDNAAKTSSFFSNLGSAANDGKNQASNQAHQAQNNTNQARNGAASQSNKAQEQLNANTKLNAQVNVNVGGSVGLGAGAGVTEAVVGDAKWSGFYEQFGTKHNMDFVLNLSKEGVVSGRGKDEVGAFTWAGAIKPNGELQMTKQYIGQHAVEYKGKLAGSVISGKYSVGSASGDFELKRGESVDVRVLVSGEAKWIGFYEQFGEEHAMDFVLNIQKNGTVQGKGSDGVGEFTWSGTVDGAGATKLTKQYKGAHAVKYDGKMSGYTVSGTYQVGSATGGFKLTRE